MHPLTSPTIEPGAVPGDPKSNGMPKGAIKGPAQWGTLGEDVPPSFVSVTPIVLAAGSSLYRVFSYPTAADPYPSWEVGSWWSPVAIPPDEATWRGEFAVEESWNGGQYDTQWILPAETYVWSGPTSLQPGEYTNGEPADEYYLPGGATQIYVAPNLMNIGTWNASQSPWTIDSLPPPASMAPAPSQTESGLAERLGELSDCFASMAKEARQKGVTDVHLLFMAGRVALERDLLQRYISNGDDKSKSKMVQRLTTLSRKVFTYYPWSENSATAAALVTDIVVRADTLMRASW
jgi:hypothetical protein